MKKKASPKSTARKAPKKKLAAKKPAAKQKLAAKRAKPAAKPKSAARRSLQPIMMPAPTQAPTVIALPRKPGVHLPMKPAPAYSHMIERAWAHKPPPHKLTK